MQYGYGINIRKSPSEPYGYAGVCLLPFEPAEGSTMEFAGDKCLVDSVDFEEGLFLTLLPPDEN